MKKGNDGHDPLYKIRPSTNAFIQHCRDQYTPGRELSIDELMVGIKGRLSFIQYLPNKPTKWAFVLADSASINWRLYTGIY